MHPYRSQQTFRFGTTAQTTCHCFTPNAVESHLFPFVSSPVLFVPALTCECAMRQNIRPLCLCACAHDAETVIRSYCPAKNSFSFTKKFTLLDLFAAANHVPAAKDHRVVSQERSSTSGKRSCDFRWGCKLFSGLFGFSLLGGLFSALLFSVYPVSQPS